MTGGRDIRLSFDAVPEIYDRARPSYPGALFDVLFDALPADPKVVEMGPGTGQATSTLLERGATVTAVEFGPNLAKTLREKFPAGELLTIVNAAFETAELQRAGFDAVVAATAYHWVDPAAQVDRPLELLRPGGVLGAIDLIQVESPASRGYFDVVQPIYDRYDNANPPGWTPSHYETAEPAFAARLRASGRYERVDVIRHPWDQTYTAAQYRDLLWSYSGTQMMSEPARSAMVDELIAVVEDDFDGVITRPLCATLTLAVAP